MNSRAVIAIQPNSVKVERAIAWYCREPESNVLGSRVRKTARAIIQPMKIVMLTSHYARSKPARARLGRNGNDVVAEDVGHGDGDGDHERVGDEDPTHDLALPVTSVTWVESAT